MEVKEDTAPVPAVREQATTPQAILALAVEKGADPAVISKMMDLQERWEANEAKKAYVRAMAAFKQDAPAVLSKDAAVDFTNKSGQRTHYKHTTLGSVVLQITSIMGRHGLSASWSTEQKDTGSVTVTCHITHELGHSEGVTLTAPPDASGNKNLIQQVGSTVTYLQRYTLLAALGLATSDQDDDGVKAGPRIEDAPSEAQRIADHFNRRVVEEPAESKRTDGAAQAVAPPTSAGSPSPEQQLGLEPPNCPKCGGPMWDNTDKRKAAQDEGKPKPPPAYSCKAGRWDKELRKKVGCDGVVWAAHGEETLSTAAARIVNTPASGKVSVGQLKRIEAVIKQYDIVFNRGEMESMIQETGCESGKQEDMTETQANAFIAALNKIGEGGQ